MQCAAKGVKHHSSKLQALGERTDVSEYDYDSTDSSDSKFNESYSERLYKRSKSICSYLTDDFTFGYGREGLYSNDEASDSSLEMERRTSPTCLSWAHNFYKLLSDPHGVKLFQSYLEEEDSAQAEMLTFLFALQGLKKKEQHKSSSVTKVIKAIYRYFFHQTKLAIPKDLHEEVHKKFKGNKNMLRSDIYNEIQKEVEERIKKTGYIKFLRSDMYLRHIEAVKTGNQCCSGCSDNSSSSDEQNVSRIETGKRFLSTVHEDFETTPCSSYKFGNAVKQLTRARNKSVKTQITQAVVHRHEPEEPADDATLYKEIKNVVNPNKIKEGVVYHRLREYLTPPKGENTVVRGQIVISSFEEFSASLTEKLKILLKKQCWEEEQEIEMLKKHQKQQRKNQESNITLMNTLHGKEDTAHNEAILDDHILRVWSDAMPSPMVPRAELEIDSSSVGFEDGSSVFSADPENFLEFPEEAEYKYDHDYNMPRSSLLSNYQEAYSAVSGYDLHHCSSKETICSRNSSGYLSGGSTWTRSSWSSSSKAQCLGKQSACASKKTLPTVRESSTASSGGLTPVGENNTISPRNRPSVSLPSNSADYTIAIISLCNKEFPYRVKIPGQSVTLGQFKDFLPKKGKYQYFFKTEWDEVDIKVVQVEIMKDDEILPLWKGVIMARVQNIQ